MKKQMGDYSEFDTSVTGKTIGAAVMLINAIYRQVKNVTIDEETILLTTHDNRAYRFRLTELIEDLAVTLGKTAEEI